MADWFKARFLVKRNERRADDFQTLADMINAVIDDGAYEELDVGAFQHF